MIPIRDHNPSGIQPRVTQGLIVLNVAMFLYTQLILQGQAQAQFLFDWSLIPLRLHLGLAWLTPLSAMFLHGGWLHLGGNMLFLWIFGDNVEARLGRWPYLGFYLLCGLIAALAEYLQDPFARVQILGASGAIAGVLGAYLRFYPRARVDVFFFFLIFWRILPIPAWAVLGVWIGMQLFAGLSLDAQLDGVAYWEHIGGFAAGFLIALLIRPAPPPATPGTWASSAIPKVPRRP
ncbi:rhomboid family intramembrane serine protease [bacterium]|nr:rhomboid family intramembrane serine protease [bacterium]